MSAKEVNAFFENMVRMFLVISDKVLERSEKPVKKFLGFVKSSNIDGATRAALGQCLESVIFFPAALEDLMKVPIYNITKEIPYLYRKFRNLLEVQMYEHEEDVTAIRAKIRQAYPSEDEASLRGRFISMSSIAIHRFRSYAGQPMEVPLSRPPPPPVRTTPPSMRPIPELWDEDNASNSNQENSSYEVNSNQEGGADPFCSNKQLERLADLVADTTSYGSNALGVKLYEGYANRYLQNYTTNAPNPEMLAADLAQQAALASVRDRKLYIQMDESQPTEPLMSELLERYFAMLRARFGTNIINTINRTVRSLSLNLVEKQILQQGLLDPMAEANRLSTLVYLRDVQTKHQEYDARIQYLDATIRVVNNLVDKITGLTIDGKTPVGDTILSEKIGSITIRDYPRMAELYKDYEYRISDPSIPDAAMAKRKQILQEKIALLELAKGGAKEKIRKSRRQRRSRRRVTLRRRR